MNIQKLLNSNPEGVAIISLADLKEFGLELLSSVSKDQEKSSQVNNEGDCYYSRSETKKILKVSNPTLWRWAKSNYLVPTRIGSKLLYKKEDVDRLLGQS